MEKMVGIPVSEGIAIAEAVLIDSEDYKIPRRVIRKDLCDSEIVRVNKSFDTAIADLTQLESQDYDLARKTIEDIYAVHHKFLQDDTLRKKIHELIRNECVTAEYAVHTVFNQTADIFSKLQNQYMRERASDISDIEKRILKYLIELKEFSIEHIDTPVIVVAKDLRPTQIARFNPKYILGIACDAGGKTSHAAIIAKAMGIPAIFALEDFSSKVRRGYTVIVDANNGEAIVSPDDVTLQQYKTLADDFSSYRKNLEHIKYEPAETKDGAIVNLLANIGFTHEIEYVLAVNASGVGLFRTEFLYLESGKEPSEDDHFESYKSAATLLDNKPLVIRTMDLGADKFTQSHRFSPETNPFLGLRSVRFSLKHLDMFKTQLRAILRASVFGNIKILLPLITNIREIRQVKELLAEVYKQLDDECVPYNRNIPLGIMIETPAAALTTHTLAKEVDFFSIGTNDLTQYALATDRGNAQVKYLFSSAEPSVLYLIKRVIEQAQISKTDLSVCGEMASNPKYVMLLLGMGIRTLSISTSMILEVKQIIRSTTIQKCEEVAKIVLSMESEEEVSDYLAKIQKQSF